MKANELREKSVEELQAHLIELAKESFALRMQKSSGDLAQTHGIKQLRREVARTKTLINEKGVKS